MTEYYLIAHKVRGEPAFDIAIKFRCPICEGARQGLDNGNDYIGNCTEDDWWWIIPTSGHRAYPYWSVPLEDLRFYDEGVGYTTPLEPAATTLPPDWPDHYQVSAAPKGQGQITASQLGKLLNLGRYAKPEGPPLRRPI